MGPLWFWPYQAKLRYSGYQITVFLVVQILESFLKASPDNKNSEGRLDFTGCLQII